MENIVSRLKEYLDFRGVSVSMAEKTIGVSNASLSKPFNNKTSIKTETLESFLKTYPEISSEWLLTGCGEMIKKELNSGLTVRKLKTDHVLENQDIPLYDVQVAAGVVDLFDGSQKQIPVDYIRIPKLPKCDGALYVMGDSMYPLLKSGDIVMYKEIHNIQHNIIWGEMYLAYINNDGNEYFFTKFIKKSEREGYVQFVSQNQHHQTIEFPITSIKALALVKASIRINSQL